MDEMILINSAKLQNLLEEAIRKVLKETEPAYNDYPPMTIREASQYLNLSVSTLYRYTSQRLIPHHKPGKQLYFLRDELDQWLSDHRKSTAKEIAADDFIFKNKKIGKTKS